MKAVMLANDLIASGSADTVIGGGQESMSNAPFLLPKARGDTDWVTEKWLITCFWMVSRSL
ncbi:MAG: hypothetical protein Ct9H300mP14_12650 [Gammaproteobacteria bacterium]|nr:MAG: hypothetical protein Ct9H300mP14_12650 [Gammaproteobacteria bacterium]